MTGYRATVAIREPADCPVALASAETGKAVDDVARSSRPTTDGAVLEEFRVTGDGNGVDAGTVGVDVEPVTESETESVYRFERDWREGCVCDVIESCGTPVASVRADDGALLVSLRSGDLESISDIVGDLKGQFEGVHLRELAETGDGSSSDLVLVDRGRLTDRQREVLETAHEMGYFEYPKRSNAGEVAEALGISGSTFAEHLAAAQRKLMDALVEF
ncbi:helix-turn-helix domain-containing protein [Salinilacihabitans rarus]|uniref:helix-turn-helix domain-containing protein n=1 Tax=Salinilacihabitans rarus TaxID=2961596 RepID=UPI0020C92DEE|nr:helix-turn-helix domain-containing protein [Salinilacihabitans rarus]